VIKLSVIVSAVGQVQFVAECLASLRAQTLSAHEVLVMDAEPTRGAARNAGVARATGDFVVTIDAADRLDPEALAAYTDAI
jgi:glycosyltransferase involved in cell wall biosynthesis